MDHSLSQREDPARSVAMERVLDKTLGSAETPLSAMAMIDIYSCFPCAVTTVAQQLNLPTDGSRCLTATGGLPYFGGPGNNYSMHALAEAVHWTRQQPAAYAMVTSNGGVLSKHGCGIFSHQPSAIDWAAQATKVSNESLKRRSVAADPGSGTIASYTVHFDRDQSAHAIILGETDAGERFVACTAPEDLTTAVKMLEQDPTGQAITVAPPVKERLHFTLSD
jgi:acetyl-CoA C-acetyltransferase